MSHQFLQVTLISSEVAVPVSEFFGRRFPFRTPGKPFWSLSVGKESLFAPNSPTVSPICEPSVPTVYSHLEQSDRAGFGIFRLPVPVLDPPRAVLEPKCRKSVPLPPKLPNRESYLRAASSYSLLSSRAKCSCRFQNFPVAGSRSGPPAGHFGAYVSEKSPFAPQTPEPCVLFGSHQFPQLTVISSEVAVPVSDFSGRRFQFRTAGGPFWSLSVGKASLFAPNSLTVTTNCEPSVPTRYSHLERSGRAGFGIFRQFQQVTLISSEVAVPISEFSGRRFLCRTPGGPFWSLSAGEESLFAPISLTVSPICVQSVPTTYSHLERSGRAVFRIFRSPVPVSDPRRAVLEPKCRKRVPFRPNSLTLSPIWDPSVPPGYSHLERSDHARFGIFRSPVPFPDPRLAVLEPKCQKSVPFHPKLPNLPTGYSHLERSGRASFGFFRSPVPVPDPRRAVLEPKCRKRVPVPPNSLTVSPICEPSVPTGYSHLERSDRAGFGIFRSPVPDPDPRRAVLEPKCRKSPVPVPDPRRAVLEPKCRKSVPFRPKLLNRDSKLPAVCSYRLLSYRAKWPWRFRNFPVAGFRSGPPAFQQVTLISSEVAVPISEFSGHRFPFRTPGGPFWSLCVGEESLFAPNSLTVCLIWEPSVPTAYSHLRRSDRAGFRIFRSPVPVPDPRRSVLEPECRKSVPFRLKLPSRESYLRAVSSNRLLSSRAKWPCRFPNFSVTVSRPGPLAGRFGAQVSEKSHFSPQTPEPCVLFGSRQFIQLTLISSEVPVPVSEFSDRRFQFRTAGGPFWSLSVGKAALFALNSLTVTPNCEPSVPTGEVTVPVSEFSGRRFPFRTPGGPFSSHSVGKASLFTPNSLPVSPICESSVPTGYYHLERSGRSDFGIFRQFLQLTLISSEVAVPVSEFSGSRFPFRTPGGPFWSLSVGKESLFAQTPCRESYLHAASSYSLLSSRAKCSCRFQNFPVAGSRSGPPAGHFGAYVSEKSPFSPQTPEPCVLFGSHQFPQLTVISSEVAVPVSEFSGRRFQFRTAGGPFWSLSVGKASLFAPNSLTVTPNCEPSVPTRYSHLERSGRAGFGIFRQFQQVTLISSEVAVPISEFSSRRFPCRTPGGPFWSLSAGEESLFAPISLTVSPICVQSVPTTYSHLERSGRAVFRIFRSPVPVSDPRRAVLEPKCRKRVPYRPNSLTVSPIWDPSVPTGYSHLERSDRARFGIFRSPVPFPDPRLAVLEPKCRKSVPFHPKLPNLPTGYSHLERSGRASFGFFRSPVPVPDPRRAVLVPKCGKRVPVRPKLPNPYSHLERSACACFGIFLPPVPVPDRRRAVLEPKCRKSVAFRPKLLNRDSKLRAVCSYRLLSSQAKWPWRFRNFPVAGSRSEPPAFQQVTLISSEVVVPISEFSGHRFPFCTPGGPFWIPSVGEESLFGHNSQTVCLIWEPSVPTAYSHLRRSDRAGFRIFRSPVPVPDRRRAVLETKCRKSPVPVPNPRQSVLEPECRKSVPLRPKLPNRESYLRAVSSNRLLSSRAKWSCRFQNFPVTGSRSGPPAGRFGSQVSEKSPFSAQTPKPCVLFGSRQFQQLTLISGEVTGPVSKFCGRRFSFRTPGGPFWSKSVGKASLFAPNSLTVSPVCGSSVPTGYYHLKRSDRSDFGIFRSPVPIPNPRLAVFEPKCLKIAPFRPNLPNHESYLRAVSSYNLLSSPARWPCQFPNFPFLQLTLISSEVAVPVSEFSGRRFPFRTLGKPIWSLSVGKESLFAPNSLTVSPICEPSVPTGYSHLERSGRASFGIFRSPVPVPDPRRAVLEPKCRKRVPFRPNSLTVSPIWEPSVPTGYSHLERSDRARFGIFRSPVPISDPRRAVLEPKYRKSVPFHPKLPNLPTGYSHLERSGRASFGIFRSPVPVPDPRRAVLEPKCRKRVPFQQVTLISGEVAVPISEFSGHRFPSRTPGGPFWSPSVGEESLFAPNSRAVCLIWEPSVPTTYTQLERSARACFGIFRPPVPVPDRRRAVLEPKCRKSVSFRPELLNRDSKLRAVCSYRLLSSRAKWPWRFRNFPVAGSRSGPPAFQQVTLISSEVAVPISEFSGHRFPFRTPGGPFWSPSVEEESLFAPNSLTVCLIWEPSVPTAYSHLRRSDRADFRIFRLPVPVLDHRRSVLGPECRKSVPFRPELPNRESYLRVVSSDSQFLQLTLISSEVAVPVSEFSGSRFPFRTPGGPFWSLSVTLISSEVTVPVSEFSGRRFPFPTPGGPFWSLSVGKASLFPPNSLTVSPICVPPVPTAHSHLERSVRAGVGIFRWPVPVPDPRRAVLEPKCRRRVPFRPKLPSRVSYLGAVSSYSFLPSRAKWPCQFRDFPVAGSSYSHLERSACGGFGIFRLPVPVPDPRRSVLEAKCRKSVPFRPKLPNHESYLGAVSSNRLLSSRAKWPCRFQNFPVTGSRPGPPAGRFGAQVSEKSEVTVPVSEFSGRRFPFRTPGGPFWSKSVGKASLFAPNSQAVSPICESSVPTGYYHLERSGRSDFGIFRSPVPIPNPRRAVLEPKCRKIAPFRPNLPNHESYLRAVSSYNLLSSPARWPCRFRNFPFLQVTLISSEAAVPVSEFSGRRFPFPTPGGPFWSLSVGKESLFAPNSLTVSPICEPSVPTGYCHLKRSDRTGLGIFRSPVPVPDPRRAVLGPKCRKSVPLPPKLPNRESYLRAASSYGLLSSRAKCSCRCQNFPVAGSASGPPAGRFGALLSSRAKWPCRFQNFPVAGSHPGPPAGRFGAQVSEKSLFSPQTPEPCVLFGSRQFLQLTLSSSEVPVPVSEFSDRRFQFRTAGGPFWSLSVGKAYLFALNSLTVTPNCEPSIPTGEVTVPISEFFGCRFPFWTPGGPFWSQSVGKASLFAPNSLSVSPIWEPSVPTGYSHLERSDRARFGIFRSPVPISDPRRAVLEPKSRKSVPFHPKLPNRESDFRRFPFPTPGGPFWSLSVGKESLFASNSLTMSPICEPSVPTGYCHLKRSDRHGLGIFRSPVPFLQLTLISSEVFVPVSEFSGGRFPFRTPGGPFWSLSVGEESLFAPNSRTVCLIWEPSIPTAFSHLERSGRASFRIFRSPVPVPDRRRAVLEPKCRKSVPFRPKLLNRDSKLRAVCSYSQFLQLTLISSEVAVPVSEFSGSRFPFQRRAVLKPKCRKRVPFRPNSLTVSPILEPSVPTGYSHLERSDRARFGIFRSPVPISDPRRAVLEPKCRKSVPFLPKLPNRESDL
ncbi:hypothetical protein MRB53_013050 [Persea americana]|nr:hypothetical protein MRB53_013050 [Persea americana]